MGSAVYYKFKCESDSNYRSLTFEGCFISVGNLKRIISESTRMGKTNGFGKFMPFDLLVSNAQTHEEYVDECMLTPARTSVLIHRIPGVRYMPMVISAPPSVSNQDEEHHHSHDDDKPPATNCFDFDDFGDDVFAIPPPPTSKEDDGDMKIKGQSQSSDGRGQWQWQSQSSDGRGQWQSRSSDGRGPETPPQGYICHRCNLPGHFIRHCPTNNGDPNFDIKMAKKPSTGIPIPKLDGSFAAFEKETDERMPSNLPRCPCCKQVMKDAVLTSKCCFESFCYTCIRDHIISKSVCVCGATNILADHLLPNITLREAIDRISESNHKRKRHDQEKPTTPEISEGTLGSLTSPGGVEEQVQDEKKKRKKQICMMPPNAKNYMMMPFGPASSNPYIPPYNALIPYAS